MTRSNSYWYAFEAIGTVRQLTNSQSQVPDTYFYDAWGNELTSPHSQIPNPFRYVGKHGYYLDTQSALMLLGVRYEAEVGRFWSLDPVRHGGNWYVYTNNPTTYIDPSGKIPVWLIGLVGGCATEALWSGIESYLGGGSTCEIICDAGVSCIIGGAEGLITSIVPVGWEVYCLLNALSSVVSPFLSGLCKEFLCNRCLKLPSLSGPCEAFKGIVGTLAKCLGAWLSEDWAEEVMDRLFTYISRALGLGCEAYAGFEKRYKLIIPLGVTH